MSLQTSNLDEDESSFGGEFPSNVPLRGQREQETLRDFQNLEGNANEVLNERAVVVMRRMSDKLTGRDWMQVCTLPSFPLRENICTYSLIYCRIASR